MIAIVPSMIVEICLRYRKEIFFSSKTNNRKNRILFYLLGLIDFLIRNKSLIDISKCGVSRTKMKKRKNFLSTTFSCLVLVREN